MSVLAKALSLAILMGTVGQAAAADTSGALDRALAAIRQNPAATRLSSFDNFSARGVTVDRNGTEHVRLDRTYKGLPVIGGDLVVHSHAGVLKSASLTQAKPLSLSITPALTATDAIVNAGTHFGTQFDSTPSTHLVVFARSATPRLAYDVLYTGTAKDLTPIRMHYYVDAITGTILDKSNAIETGTLPGTGAATGNLPPPPHTTPMIGSGRSLLAGTVPLNTQWNATRRVYEMNDPTRGNTHIHDIGNGFRGFGTIEADGDNKWGDGTTHDRASAAVDASYGLAKTWDFYKSTFGRNGIAGDGVGALGIVHFQVGFNNAFWNNDNFYMAFGDGDGVNMRPLVAIDVMGHEMSHGVTATTAKLLYSGESGGLNEATSDILGTMVEFYANNPAQPPNYIIGDTLFITPGGFIRSMFKPSMDGGAPNYSDDCYPNANDPNRPANYLNFFSSTGPYATGGKDPHYTSGVANHFYYLLAEGSVVPTGSLVPANLGPSDLVCNGNVGLVGIGRASAQKIWYVALTQYMTSNTNYAGARVATLQAAADLFTQGSTEYNAVAAAWDAVNVH